MLIKLILILNYKWAKNLFGKNYYKKALTIVQDLSPIPWGEIREGYTRHGIGKVKMYDPIYYHVQLIYPINGYL